MEMLKLRSPYFTSVTQHSHVTNKPEADGALILPRPPLHQCSVLRVLKLLTATRKVRKKARALTVLILPPKWSFCHALLRICHVLK